MIRVIATIAAAFVLAGCTNERPAVYQGWVEANLIFVSPDEAGRIEAQPVREGDSIRAQAPLFELDADLQKAEVAEREASVKNAQQAYDRAVTLLKTNAGTQRAVDDAEAALRTSQARLNSSQTRLARRKVFSPAEGTVEQIYFRVGEMVGASRPVIALLPPSNLKVRFFVNEAALPQIKIGDTVNIACDGCANRITAKVSFIARTAEFTPPVIYSLEERGKLVYMIEARPERPDRLRVGQPVSVTLAESEPTP
jgi:HlyD family secretion protein